MERSYAKQHSIKYASVLTMSKKKGFIVGKFAPLHVGHEYFIQKSLEQCDELFILLSHDQRFFQKIPGEIRHLFYPRDRYEDLECFVQEMLQFDYPDKVIYTGFVDESDIPEYPNGWEAFIQLCLREMTTSHQFDPNIVFSSEPDYDENYKKYLPNCQHIIIEADRKTHPVSGTKIREKMVEIQKEITKLGDSLNQFANHRIYVDR